MKYIRLGKIWTYTGFLRIFPYMSLDSVHILENVVQRKRLYLYILQSVQLSLLVNLGTTFFSNALTKFCVWNAKFAALTSVHFFFQPQVKVCISGSVTIHLLGSNTESTRFQPNYTEFKLVSGVDIRFEQIKST